MKNRPFSPIPFPVYPPLPTHTKWCIYCNQAIIQGQSYRAVHRNGADEQLAHMDCAMKNKSQESSDNE